MPGGTRSVWDARFVVAVAAAFALLLLFAGRPIPIIIWDEGRIVVSAMEMRLHGLSLVATYDGHQDLWNTKPPLLIWLMTGSMALFGPTEFALRLPSLLASLGTILLVMLFLRAITRSTGIAAFGGLALAASVGFFGEHGARTGDYDALLCLLTTAYLMLLFFALHRRVPACRWVVAAGAFGGAALMTKGIAGGVPLAGVPLYLLATGRWRRPFGTPRYLVAAALAAMPLLAFLLLREHVRPGYLAAMIYNDVDGRFNEALDAHAGPPWYYLDTTFLRGLFSLGPVALLAPLALPLMRGRVRLAMIFALCIAAGQLVVVSLCATKLTHYYLSAYPFVAIAAALAVHAVLERLRALRGRQAVSPVAFRVAQLAPVLLLAIGVGISMQASVSVLAPREDYPRTRYGPLFDALAAEPAEIVALEPGWPIPDDPHYAPELRFHAMVAREQGRRIAQTGTMDGIAKARPGTILSTCDSDTIGLIMARPGTTLVNRDGCVARRTAASALALEEGTGRPS